MPIWKSILVATYVALQIVIPIPALLGSKVDSRDNFTWNMYAHEYGCEITYAITEPGHEPERIDLDAYLHRTGQVHRVLHRDVLPVFHAWLCRELRRDGRFGPVSVRVACRQDGGELTVLVDEPDVCTAPNHGVRDE